MKLKNKELIALFEHAMKVTDATQAELEDTVLQLFQADEGAAQQALQMTILALKIAKKEAKADESAGSV